MNIQDKKLDIQVVSRKTIQSRNFISSIDRPFGIISINDMDYIYSERFPKENDIMEVLDKVTTGEWSLPQKVVQDLESVIMGDDIDSIWFPDRPSRIPKNDNLVSVKRLYFNDTFNERDQDSMDLQQAISIKNWLQEYQDKIELLIIHCLGGVSRSAGVAAGLEFTCFSNQDSVVWNNKHKSPNMLCFERILEAYGIEYIESEWEEKEKMQRDLFYQYLHEKER